MWSLIKSECSTAQSWCSKENPKILIGITTEQPKSVARNLDIRPNFTRRIISNEWHDLDNFHGRVWKTWIKVDSHWRKKKCHGREQSTIVSDYLCRGVCHILREHTGRDAGFEEQNSGVQFNGWSSNFLADIQMRSTGWIYWKKSLFCYLGKVCSSTTSGCWYRPEVQATRREWDWVPPRDQKSTYVLTLSKKWNKEQHVATVQLRLCCRQE